MLKAVYEFKNMDKRQALGQCLNFFMIVTSALMIWKGLMLFTGSESPIVVVLSGSMEPAFHRGDLLFLSQDEGPFQVGDIVVFRISGRDIPIVHRIIIASERPDGDYDLLTKGDNNPVDDRGLYDRHQLWLNRQHVIGRAKGFLPYVGIITIFMNDYPWMKHVLIGLLGLFVITSKE